MSKVADALVRPADDWVQVGVIAGARGVQGELKVDLTTDFPDRFALLHTIFVGPAHLPKEVIGARRHGDRVLLRLHGVTDRNAADALRGLALYVPREAAVPLPEGHYYHDQILDLRVLTTGGDCLGVVEEILSTGSNDVYVVHDGTREVLIPAIRDVVRQIDLARGIMIVDPIDGLL